MLAHGRIRAARRRGHHAAVLFGRSEDRHLAKVICIIFLFAIDQSSGNTTGA